MDTLKSLAVITLLGAVLYGVYVVASKPDKPLSPELEALANSADAPLIERGDTALSPPRIETESFQSADRDHAAATAKAPALATRAVTETPADSAPPQDPYVDRGASGANTSLPDPAVRRGPNQTISYDLERPETADDYSTGVERDRAAPKKPTAVEIGSGKSSSEHDPEIEAAKQRIRLYAFQQAWKTARDQVSQGRHREALLALTPFYNDSAIPANLHEELIGWLDALAAKVVYSTEHLLEPAHEVRRGETLYTIADKHRVPFLLLKNINAVRDNDVLLPGSKLKVITGPFQAEVDLSRQQITVFVQKLYAGRFPFTLGNDPAPPGEYLVIKKEPAKEFSSPQGVLSAKDPRNPYGGLFIDLGQGVSLHGSPGEAYADQRVGCIQLAPRDAEDLFAILSRDESTVTIHK